MTSSSNDEPEHDVNENVNLAAPSGAALDLVTQHGVNVLGADCVVISMNGFVR